MLNPRFLLELYHDELDATDIMLSHVYTIIHCRSLIRFFKEEGETIA